MSSVKSPAKRRLSLRKKLPEFSLDNSRNDNVNNMQARDPQNDETACSSKNERTPEKKEENPVLESTPKKMHAKKFKLQICFAEPSTKHRIDSQNNTSKVKDKSPKAPNEHSVAKEQIPPCDKKSTLITVRKIEDLCKSPRRILVEDTITDAVTTGIESHSNIALKSPPSNNANKTMHTTPNKKMELFQEMKTPVINENERKRRIHPDITPPSTPGRSKKKKHNNIDVLEELTESMKLELLDTTLVNELEPIDLLHDVNSMVDFVEINVTPYTVPLIVPDVIKEDIEDNTSEMATDPSADPLFISASEASNIVSHFLEETKPMLQANDTVKKGARRKYVQTWTKSRFRPRPQKDDTPKVDLEQLKLRDMEVKLEHDVPPPHKDEPYNDLGESERRHMFMKHGVWRTTRYTPKEDDIIRRNWIRFCEVHDWDSEKMEPFLNLTHRDNNYLRQRGQHQKFVQFLGNGLPWRPLRGIYQRFRNLFKNYHRKLLRYTEKDDKKILFHLNRKHLKRGEQVRRVGVLSKVLGRSRVSIWNRYHLIKPTSNKKKPPLVDVKWTIGGIAELIKELMSVTVTDELIELKGATIPKPIWVKMEEKLNIDHDVLRNYWFNQLHMQLFCRDPIYLNDIQIQLIEYMYGKGIGSTREIIWPIVAKYFDGMSTLFLCNIFYYLVKNAVSKQNLKHFPDIIEYLYNEKIQELLENEEDKLLPRLRYKNGRCYMIEV